jgi:hypothetical protein
MHGLMCADCFGQVTVLIVDSPQESCNARFQTPDGDQLRQGVTSSWRLFADAESAVPRMINLFIARIFNHKAP